MVIKRKYIGVLLCLVIGYALIGLNMQFTRYHKKSPVLSARRHSKISDLKVEVTPIIIIAYMRSGSTLTGNIIQSHPETFYLFEPLHGLFRHYETQYKGEFPHFNFRSVRPSMSLKEIALKIFRAWISCDVDLVMKRPMESIGFFPLGRKTNQFIQCVNASPENGFSTFCKSLLKTSCLKSKQRVIKTIRTPMHWIYELMHEFPAMKIIHLVRDPRAIIASQQKFSKCLPEYGGLVGCSRLLCTNMEDDITMFEMYNKLFPGRTMRLKYEDLATHPLNTTQSIFKYLDFELTESVIDYVKEITMSGNTPKHALDSVRPDSKSAMDAWRKTLIPQELGTIQTMCTYVLKKLSYI